MRRAVYAQGLNFMGQCGLKNNYTNAPTFSRIDTLDAQSIRQLECGLTSSFALLEDSQILHWGWVLDNLTAVRTLQYYKNAPAFCQMWQRYSFLGPTLGMRSGQDSPVLINRALREQELIKSIAVGGSFLLAITDSGKLYGMGENYKGQLGLGDTRFRMQFEQVHLPSQDRPVAVRAGFQHSLVLTESGRVYASGRTNNSQFITGQSVFVDFYTRMMLVPVPSKVDEISCGYHHSLFRSRNRLFACGLNNYGQCGIFETQEPIMRQLVELNLDLGPDETITQMVAGKSHNLLLTSKGRLIFFGATNHYQMGQLQVLGFDQSGPKEIQLCFEQTAKVNTHVTPLLESESITRIKAGYDACAAFTSTGDCFVWGGADLTQYGIPHYREPTRVRTIFGSQHVVVLDIAFGYMHTLLYVKE